MTTNDLKGKIKINQPQQLKRNLQLEKFIPAAFLIFLLCIIILSVITYYNIEEYKQDTSTIGHTEEVINKNNKIMMLTYQQIVLSRNYIITGDTSIIISYQNLKSDLSNERNQIQSLTSDNQKQQNNISLLDSLIMLQTKFIDSTIQNRKSAKEINLAYVSLKIQELNDRISEASKRVEEEEQFLLNQRTAKAGQSNADIQLFIIITSSLGFIVIFLSLYISNKLIRNKNTTDKLLEKSYEELEYKVKERTEELKHYNDKLTEEVISREKTEKTLRESEKRFKTMADSAPVLIWISDRSKLSTYFNKTWLDFTGRTLAQELGSGWTENVHPDDLQNCKEIYENAFNKRFYT